MPHRIIFMGTPEFAVPSLQALVDSPQIEVAGVITQPDRRAGRGRRRQTPPVKLLAQSAGLDVLQTPSLRKDHKALSWIERREPDLAVVAAFGQILPREIFEAPRHGTVNVHASLLPRHRGAAPVAYAILADEEEAGVTIMLIAEGLDTGDILTSRSVPIGENQTRGQLEAVLAKLGADLLIESIGPYMCGEIRPRPQDDSQATLAPMIKKPHAFIDWSASARQIHCRIRAFNPWPGARCFLGGRTITLWESRLVESEDRSLQDTDGGRILPTGESLQVVCGDGRLLELRVLQAPGRKRLNGREFINGFGLNDGDRFA